ncbi:hypothetical protein [Caldisericum exile]|uniref:Uncharacterized protein n=1 Tax=Caldisericum exile (strain DSM 21853 / NBRC 104410 / AZM16c01) TaxID=511051 RepID=A0A7U6GEW1_CALEA|nr:hypothetical protein [Caldisericum exile]BAL81106.1 hypothetical protein CSE_09800 [Caldisericum exile AZM16c01]
MKILGLLDLNKLKISEKEEVNFENYRIFSYRLSELGADGIYIKGINKDSDLIFINELKNEIDIPIFKENDFEDIIHIEEFLKGKKGTTLIIEEEEILEHFDGRKEFVPIYTALISYKAKKEGFITLIVEDIEAVKASLKFE